MCEVMLENPEEMTLEEAADSANSKHLLLLVHGINTRALWMDEIGHQLEKSSFFVAPISYGEFGIPRFLSFPFSHASPPISHGHE